MSQTEELYIGLMSGTSVDGIDAALVAFESRSTLRVIETQLTPFPEALRAEINQTALNNSHLFRNEDSPLHIELANHYCDAALNLINKAGINHSDVQAIANHGQTVRHEPNAESPFSLQLGDGQLIASKTGIRTITQFRQADIAAGGQGAPLMPAFHNAVFEGNEDTLVLNLGGIANITQLGEHVTGFDTGPGNCLLDQWIAKHKNQPFDINGKWGASGDVIDELLSRLLSDPYFAACHPKSTGTDYFNLDWLGDLDRYSPENVQATLVALTVNTVAKQVIKLSGNSGKLFICGGGAHNQHLIDQLRAKLSGYTVNLTDIQGIPVDWVEAVGFAWLGYCRLNNLNSNLPSVTGARKQLSLGEIYLP